MIYRVTIRNSRPWRSSVVADSEFEALKIAISTFRKERKYEPKADDIFIGRDIEHFFRRSKH